jgi:hypothetical protein
MAVTEPTKFCLNCGHALDGLTEPRCPECGGKFNPADPSTYGNRRPNTVWPQVWRGICHPVALLAEMWACAFLPVVAPLLLPLALAAIAVHAQRRRWVSVCALVLLGPWTLFFTLGAVAYFDGSAQLLSVGLPGTRSHNIDPDYRCGHSSSGCRVFGNEWLTHGCYNGAVKSVIILLGPMRGSYGGPYPTEAEAAEVLRAAQPISWELLTSDRLTVDGTTVSLDSGVGAKLLERTCWAYLAPTLPAGKQIPVAITGALYQQRCLVLRIPTETEPREPGESVPAMIVLIDTQCGRPFAYYAEGGYHHNFPPVRWHK